MSDDECFAKDVYEYLYAGLKRQQEFEEGKNLHITPEHVRLVAANNEIHIDDSTEVPNEMIKWILESYLKSDSTRFKGYNVIQFGDTFTIGRMIPASEMGMYSCEICSYSTPYQEELYTHRMMHFGI